MLIIEAGIRPGRLRFAHVTANMGAEFSRIALEMADQLEELTEGSRPRASRPSRGG